ncbi:hypothetical protein BEWA_035540 [Theileria equi strain WA]|uniref:Uncharacterized protein n=1 Tax=Theileria equi strain WA TaxID=1537102 RepID=L1LEB9_THEEQ|nr:hypothetical protein BEWA_035540 [Theileria equi strain WA]EKX73518.1 hypothetical protein BEWA_035540 [Theileria equi strain WA]|eukprot:XP_004832970.1 hypothetical protein BEWA_035540 [Theileria equi strain WA]
MRILFTVVAKFPPQSRRLITGVPSRGAEALENGDSRTFSRFLYTGGNVENFRLKERKIRRFSTQPEGQVKSAEQEPRNLQQIDQRSHGAYTKSEEFKAPRLDKKGFERDNFRRLRPFLKFLAFQSIPVAVLAFIYKKLEKRKLELQSVPLESVEEVVEHVWKVAKEATCFCEANGKFLQIHPVLERTCGFIRGRPLKTSLDLDLSAPLPEQVTTISLNDYDRAHLYTIKPEYANEYKIGKVVDGSILVSEDHLKIIERKVFFASNSDNVKCVEIVNAYINNENNIAKDLEEFEMLPSDEIYHPVIRIPIELNLFQTTSTKFIHVETIMENVRHYSVQQYLKYDVVIGKVKYGEYILDDAVEGVLQKRVVFSKSEEEYSIEIISIMNDWTRVKSQYVSRGEDKPFLLTRKSVEHMPW